MATQLPIRVLALVLFLFATAIAVAEEQPAAKDSERRLPLRGKIALEQESFLGELASLQAKFAEEIEPTRAHELQREITKLKLQHEINLYRHQLEALSAKGPSEHSERMAASISALEELLTELGFETAETATEDAAQ